MIIIFKKNQIIAHLINNWINTCNIRNKFKLSSTKKYWSCLSKAYLSDICGIF